MINKIIDIISKVGEVIAKSLLYIILKFFSVIFNSVRIIFKIFMPILSKALVYIIVLVVVAFILFNYIL